MVSGFEVVKEAVPVEDYARTPTDLKPEGLRQLVGWCPVRDALKEMRVERVRQALMRLSGASELAGIPNLDERAAKAALVWDGSLPVAKILDTRPREDLR